MTFGALSLAGGDLTMASIAVLPVLIGLAVDYAIQFQARFDEAVQAATGAPGGRRPPRPGGPTIVTAGRGNRRRLPRAAAVARADGARLRRAAGGRGSRSRSLCAMLRGLRRARALLAGPGPRPPIRDCAPAAGAAPPARARRRASGSPTAPGAHSALALSRPRRVLAVGLAVALLGLALDTQSEVVVGRARARAAGPRRRSGT